MTTSSSAPGPQGGRGRGALTVLLAAIGVAVLGALLWLIGADPAPSKSANDLVRSSASERAQPETDANPDLEDDAPSPTAAARKIVLEVAGARSGAPVVGAAVELVTLAGKKAAGRTDDDGLLELDLARPFPVEVSAVGFRTQTFRPPRFGDAPEVFWSVKLERDGKAALVGRVTVTYDDGDPREVKGAVVVVEADPPEESLIARTNAKGQFAFTDLPANPRRVWASSRAHGWSSATIPEPLESGPAEAEEQADAQPRPAMSLELPGGAFVEGTVLDEAGQPLPKFTVRLSPKGLKVPAELTLVQAALAKDRKNKQLQGKLRWLSRSFGAVDSPSAADKGSGAESSAAPGKTKAKTQASGAFRAGPVQAATVDVIAWAPGLEPARVDGIPLRSGQTVRDVKLVLRSAAVLSGRVVDIETGQAIGKARVAATGFGRERIPGFSQARTGGDGTFSLPIVADTRQRLSVTARGYLPFEEGGIVAERGEELSREVGLRRVGKKTRKFREYVGIGASVRKVDDGVLILDTIKGGAAAEELQKGDVIVRVDDEWIDDLELKEAIELLVGEDDTDVQILVQRPSGGQGTDVEELDLSLKRRRLKYHPKR